MLRHAIDPRPNAGSPQTKPIRVAIVDDSTVATAMIGWMLEQAGMAVVATARNGRDAITALAATEVDVLVLDLEMPRMDGLSALPEILNTTSAAVLVVSSLTTQGARSTIEALRLGAADTLAKPDMMPGSMDSRSFGVLLVEKVQALGKGRALPRTLDAVLQPPVPLSNSFEFKGPLKVIAIAASTGGPTAMFELFDKLEPSLNVPILVTQHLPAPFVPVFAEHLSRHARRPAMVVTHGQRLRPGAIHLAPGAAHLDLESRAGKIVVRLRETPMPSGCMPSADPMFASVAEHFGAGALAIILSGMGRDGAEGAARIGTRGGSVIVQDMRSSVVWGMPGAAYKRGAANICLPPAAIAALINSIGVAAE